jgi:hypothetical protein
VSADQITRDQRGVVEQERELAESLGAVERARDQAGHDRLAVVDEAIDPHREALALRRRCEDLGAEEPADLLGVAHVIRVGDHDLRDAAERLDVLPIVLRQRQRIDRDVAVAPLPEERVEVDVPLLVELRPGEEIGPM